MTAQLLFYKQAVPVSKEQHGNLCIDTKNDYSFTNNVNSVPLTAVEFPNAARDYVIVFAGKETLMPAVLLGVQQDKNLYVDEHGAWTGRYIPAFIRRYPFVFSSSKDGKTFTLCIDKEFQGLNNDGQGERLFNDEGDQTEYLGKMLDFLREYQIQFQRTKVFCDKLRELDLLESMQAHFTFPTGSQISLTGFYVVNREKLKAVEGKKLAELAKTDELELVYLHLQSLNNFPVMIEKTGGKSAKQ